MMFSDARSRISATDVAEHVGVSRSTAYRYAQTLSSSGFLVEESGNGFRLGPKVMELARIARRSHGISDMAVPVMRQLASELHETVLLTKRIGPTIVCLEREEWPGQYIRLSYERGSRLSLNAGASALVLLAWMPDDEARGLLDSQTLQSYSANTLTSTGAILERLHEIRELGYSVARGEVDAEAMGIAAPIFDADGQVTAALSIAMLQSRLPKGRQSSVVGQVRAAAARLTEEVRSYTE